MASQRMKYTAFVILALCLRLPALAQETPYTRVFFDNSLMPENYFYSSASYTSPSWVKNSTGKLPVSEDLFFTPGNALELQYTSAKGGKWQAQVLYHPLRGVDFFRPQEKLVFYLLVKSQTVVSELPAIAIGMREAKKLSEAVSLQPYISKYKTGEWLRVEVPLSAFKGLSFGKPDEVDVVAYQQQSDDGKHHELYLDQLELQPQHPETSIKAIPKLLQAKGYEKHVDLAWEKISDPAVRYVQVYCSSDNKTFKPVAMQLPLYQRYADYVDTVGQTFYYRISLLDDTFAATKPSESIKASTRPMTNEELLAMVQEANFRYYWEGAEPNSGLALENIPGRRTMIASGASGFGLMAILVGMERGWITREQGVARFSQIVQFLDKAEKFHGAFSHFISGETGKVVPFFGPKDNGADLVETAFLMQGLLAAKAYFSHNDPQEKAIRDTITKLWRGVEWDWFRKKPETDYLTWHWSPDQAWVLSHQLIGWNETMIVYLLAIASPTHSVPASMYYSGWASQSPKAQQYRTDWGQTKEGAMYTNGNTYFGVKLPVGVSNGGPLFFVHYSFMGADPHQLTDKYTNYFENNRAIARINYRYCIENPAHHQGYGENSWGLTASDGPWGYAANEPVPHADSGKMTPTGALASFPYTPEESRQALAHYYRNYGKFLWGSYGFRDAFNLDENWVSPLFMGLNQAPVTVMIENYRSGLIWKLFMSNPEITKAVNKIKKGK
ncbi:glucoamylase family protein [Pontibacter liquoris]|uniref:glucoamylase family protein n=1 Tax=Pontibacter liquoris TaxID=2905677 RepID=UPI001FA7F729|nr:glucoamylase family protein [Pontibacter liquoris]